MDGLTVRLPELGLQVRDEAPPHVLHGAPIYASSYMRHRRAGQGNRERDIAVGCVRVAGTVHKRRGWFFIPARLGMLTCQLVEAVGACHAAGVSWPDSPLPASSAALDSASSASARMRFSAHMPTNTTHRQTCTHASSAYRSRFNTMTTAIGS